MTTSRSPSARSSAARGREWVVLPESEPTTCSCSARSAATDDEITGILPALEPVSPATFDAARPEHSRATARSAGCSATRSGSASARAPGPFRSFGQIAVEPRPYQLVPLLMALQARPGPAADRRRRRHRQDDRGGADRPRAARPGRRRSGSPCSARRTSPSSGRPSCATSSTSTPSSCSPAPHAGSSAACGVGESLFERLPAT